jgi:hypothetical protein
MFPITGSAHFEFYKYPGGIPVKGSSGSSPRILPVEVKLHEYCFRACIATSERDIGNRDVIGKKGAGNTQQRTEQEGSYGSIVLHELDKIIEYTQLVYFDA